MSQSDVALRAYLFGNFAIWRGDVLMELPKSARARALLAYLLLNREQAHARAVLSGRFWPDTPESKARRFLSTALWYIRSTLPEIVCTHGDVIQALPGAALWIDVEVFANAARPHLAAQTLTPEALSDLRRAVALYSGDLLAGFYEDWVMEEQERLKTLYHRTLEHLIHMEKASGNYDRALDMALKLTHSNPFQESAHREVMQLYVAVGRPQAALQQFETYRKLLWEELSEEPEPGTLALAQASTEAVRHAGRSLSIIPPRATEERETPPVFKEKRPSDLPLIGRDAERQQLLALLEATLQRDIYTTVPAPNVILIEGETGVGKTRLMQALANDAAWHGAEVLWSHGLVLGVIHPPYMTLVEAFLDQLSALRAKQLAQIVAPIWLQSLAQLLPPLSHWLPELGEPAHLDPDPSRDRLLEAFARVLEGWAQVVPLIVILENLHQGDGDTLRALPLLIQRLERARILFAVTYIGADARARAAAWDCIEALHHNAQADHLPLKRFSQATTAALIRSRLESRQPLPHLETRIYQETQGNPLFVLHTLRELHETGALIPDAQGRWEVAREALLPATEELLLPEAVEQAILQRMEHVSPAARQLLHAVAVLGVEIDFEILNAVSELDLAPLLESLHELLRSEFLEETAQGYCFCHDKIREVTYAAIPPSERRWRHQRAVQVLEAQQPDGVQRLAHHAIRGEVWDQAVLYSIRAAEQSAAMYAYGAALEDYNRALDLLDRFEPFASPRQQELRFEVLTARQPLLWLWGDTATQKADMERLRALSIELAAPHYLVTALNQHADVLCRARERLPKAIELAVRARQLALNHKLTEEAFAARVLEGRASFFTGAYERAAAILRHALEESAGLSEVSLDTLGELYYSLAFTYWRLGDLPAMEEITQRLLVLAEETQHPKALLNVNGLLGMLAYARGDNDASLCHTQTALERARDFGMRHEEAVQLLNLSNGYWTLGQYGAALSPLQEAIAILRERQEWQPLVVALFNLGELFRLTGRHPEAETTFEEALDVLARSEMPAYNIALRCSLAQLAADCGDVARARARLTTVTPELIATLEAPQWRAEAHLARGLVALADAAWDEATASLERAVAIIESTGIAELISLFRAHLAWCYHQSQRPADAQARIAQAVAALDAEAAGDEVQTLYFYQYHILKTAGKQEAARAALDRAYAIVQAQQATLPDPAWQQHFVTAVPVNREIVAAYQATRQERLKGQVLVYLAHIDAPTGRPLRRNERVRVIWTVDAPEDAAISGKAARRRHRLLRLLREAETQQGAPTVIDLADTLRVSGKTIRRDLNALRKAGHAVKTRGSRD